MEEEKIDIDSKLYNTPFAEQVAFNLEQLEYRYNRLVEIDTFNKGNQCLYLMTFDSFIVLFRAMFLEKGDKQYTLQNYFRLNGQNNVADKIDTYLNSCFYDGDTVSIKTVLKFIADKFVCHVDPISRMDLGLANAYMAALGNPYVKNNIRNIMKQLFDIIKEGLDTK